MSGLYRIAGPDSIPKHGQAYNRPPAEIIEPCAAGASSRRCSRKPHLAAGLARRLVSEHVFTKAAAFVVRIQWLGDANSLRK